MRALIAVLFFILSACRLFGFAFLPSKNGELIKHTYYALSYIEAHEQAEWVYYELDSNLISGVVKRTDNFRVDAKVSTGSATLTDYKGSGYDRGHLAPAGSMSGNATAMSESFYMSNMSPQHPSFNRGKWQQLESLVRSWVRTNEKLYVVTGAILSNSMGSIGTNRVSIPRYYYKVIYCPSRKSMIAFLMPNQKLDDSLQSYIVSVDKIEELTNIDFFPQLEDTLENFLESKVNVSKWSFNSSAKSTKQASSSSTKSSATSTQCKGYTKSGTRCKNKTTNPNGYCHLHQ